MYSFDDALDGVIDVTICYPDGVPTVWQLVSGQIRKIVVHIQLRPVDEAVRGRNFREDGTAKKALKAWLDNMWEDKEAYINIELQKITKMNPAC